MSFLKRLFAGARPVSPRAPNSQPASQFLPGSMPMGDQNASRRDMLRLVLRDTLNRTGIPTAWLGADLLAATSRGREPGIHVRLLIKHWDPRLMLHGVAFENTFRKRLASLDPHTGWLMGFSWQFSLASDSECPPMPHPGTWTSATRPDAPTASADGATGTRTTASAAGDLLGGSIVISGPAATPESSAARPAAAAAGRQGQPERAATPDARADLERLLAVRDQDLQRARTERAQGLRYASTEPAPLLAASADASRAASQALDAEQAFAKTDIFRRPDRATPPSRR